MPSLSESDKVFIPMISKPTSYSCSDNTRTFRHHMVHIFPYYSISLLPTEIRIPPIHCVEQDSLVCGSTSAVFHFVPKWQVRIRNDNVYIEHNESFTP